MQTPSDNLRSGNEIGKIYNSLIDKKSLCDFFPQSVAMLIQAEEGYFYLTGREGQVWLESSINPPPEDNQKIQQNAQRYLAAGKPVLQGHELYVPLIVRNDAIGIGCFTRKSSDPAFEQNDLTLAFDMASQMAGSLKNILLFEQNLEMEKLAAIGKSMGMVMHEIKNIIQLATFAEEWLTRGLEKSNQKHLERGVGGIRKALREMNGFVYEMLSLTKNYKITPQKTNVQALLKELEEDLRDRAGEYNVRLDFQAEENFPEVDAEERSLYRALLNLVKNAFEACDKEDSVIQIRVSSKDEQTYQIIVQDNGIGMTDEVKARLFSAFFTTKGEKGTGLGIMIVDRTLKAHYGKMNVESTPGQGTRFIITLPKTIQNDAD